MRSLKRGIGPKVYLFDSSKKIIPKNYLIEEFLPGKHPKRKADNHFVKLMAQWFKQLHKIKSPTKKERYSLLDSIKPYYNNFKKYGHVVDNNLFNNILNLFEESLKLCKKNDKIFFSYKKFSLLHKDCVRNNILLNNKNVRLIDWEFAEYGVPEWDLVYFLQSYDFEKHHKKLFLDTYKYPKTKKSRMRLGMISLLNLCGGVGYSLWRLALIKQGKINKKEKEKTLRRLKKDSKLLKEALIEVIE